MNRHRLPRAFTLLEVVVAVGLAATAITATLVLLPSLTRLAETNADLAVVARLPDALEIELSRMARADFAAFGASVPVAAGEEPEGLAFVATRDGGRLAARDVLAPATTLRPEEQYFLLECRRFGTEPLVFAAGRAALALQVRVSWPYRVPGNAGPVPREARSQSVFVAAINR